MEIDIENKINLDFKDEAPIAKRIIEEFEYETKLSPRVSRCIIFLAQGSINKLGKLIEEAKIDWRDIIGDAESYDFEFNKPFS